MDDALHGDGCDVKLVYFRLFDIPLPPPMHSDLAVFHSHGMPARNKWPLAKPVAAAVSGFDPARSKM